eukprot:6208941-Pleurochrysis_carterae.AAC.1
MAPAPADVSNAVPEEGRQTALSGVRARSRCVREGLHSGGWEGPLTELLTDEGVLPPRWVLISLHALPNALRVQDHRPAGGYISGRVLARTQTREAPHRLARVGSALPPPCDAARWQNSPALGGWEGHGAGERAGRGGAQLVAYALPPRTWTLQA